MQLLATDTTQSCQQQQPAYTSPVRACVREGDITFVEGNLLMHPVNSSACTAHRTNWIIKFTYTRLFSPLGKLADPATSAISNSFFLNLSQIISGSTGPIFTIFLPNERYLPELY